jgi:hypothetical protein
MLETQELLAQRQMSWTEATNRASMLITVVGATVFALALVGNATQFDKSFLMFAVIVLPIILVIGLSSLGRINELDDQDWHWVQGLNRMRHARLELDPTFAQYLVNSPYDDVKAVLGGYSVATNSMLHNLFVLSSLIAVVVALIAGAFAAAIGLFLDADVLIAILAGAITFVLLMVAISISGYRRFTRSTAEMKPIFPTPEDPPDAE